MGKQKDADEPKSNTLIDERRVGKFAFAISIIRNTEYEILLKVMANFLITRAEADFIRDAIEYQAYSPLFGVVDASEQVPDYAIEIQEGGSVRVFRY